MARSEHKKNHRFKWSKDDRAQALAAIQSQWLWLQDQPEGMYDSGIKRHYLQRTGRQNAYYWGVVNLIIAAHLGLDKDACHRELCLMFHWEERTLRNGTVVREPKSTAADDTVEFSTFVETCRMWALQSEGCYVPAPNEVTAEMEAEVKEIYQSMFR